MLALYTFSYCCTCFDNIWHGAKGPVYGGFRHWKVLQKMLEMPEFFRNLLIATEAGR
jgi:hypothetical protein